MTITPFKMKIETEDKEAWLEGILNIDLSKKLSAEDIIEIEDFLASMPEYFDNINYLLEGDL